MRIKQPLSRSCRSLLSGARHWQLHGPTPTAELRAECRRPAAFVARWFLALATQNCMHWFRTLWAARLDPSWMPRLGRRRCMRACCHSDSERLAYSLSEDLGRLRVQGCSPGTPKEARAKSIRHWLHPRSPGTVSSRMPRAQSRIRKNRRRDRRVLPHPTWLLAGQWPTARRPFSAS